MERSWERELAHMMPGFVRKYILCLHLILDQIMFPMKLIDIAHFVLFHHQPKVVYRYTHVPRNLERSMTTRGKKLKPPIRTLFG